MIMIIIIIVMIMIMIIIETYIIELIQESGVIVIAKEDFFSPSNPPASTAQVTFTGSCWLAYNSLRQIRNSPVLMCCKINNTLFIAFIFTSNAKLFLSTKGIKSSHFQRGILSRAPFPCHFLWEKKACEERGETTSTKKKRYEVLLE